jgi:hypothetical protein
MILPLIDHLVADYKLTVDQLLKTIASAEQLWTRSRAKWSAVAQLRDAYPEMSVPELDDALAKAADIALLDLIDLAADDETGSATISRHVMLVGGWQSRPDSPTDDVDPDVAVLAAQQRPKGREAVALVLSSNPGQPMTVFDVVDQLVGRGWPPNGDRVNATRTTLARLAKDDGRIQHGPKRGRQVTYVWVEGSAEAPPPREQQLADSDSQLRMTNS